MAFSLKDCVKKTVFVSSFVLVFIALAITDDQAPAGVKPMATNTRHDGRVNRSKEKDYFCGTFGQWVYRFPRSVSGSLVEYFGDEPWDPTVPKVERGCEDKFRGFLFRACVPAFRLVDFYHKPEDGCFLIAGISDAPGDQQLERVVTVRRAYRLNPEADDKYDEALGLYYYDADMINVNRIFWAPRSGARGYVSGRCSIDAPFPQCDFETYSQMLEASIEVGFAMEHIKDWEFFLRGVEDSLKHYKLYNKER